MNKLIRKFLLVKEVVSKVGQVHFRRYRLISTPWFNLYVHNIRKSDEDRDSHNHPWSFISFILSGSYHEEYREYPYWNEYKSKDYKQFNMIYHHREDVHKLKLLTHQVWSLVFTLGKKRPWGYRRWDNSFIDHKQYRLEKNQTIW